ncbi:MAG: BspA family leucine-rich repeat surface protein [Candidatus Gracilibacteria bacterium]|nr:BspA family leucine-rich repeat surface protein [Candidatus Gracilibacteria bacterium]
MNKKGFTLVELLVVIVILGILSIVAIISYDGYISTSRDSVRIGDVKHIEHNLEMYKVEKKRFPQPEEAHDVSYSGSLVWTQGIFGSTAYTKNVKVDNVRKDPATGISYAYSLTHDKKEFQIGAVLEGDGIIGFSPTSYANNKEGIAYVKGNYNGKIITVTLENITDEPTYILGVPSILSTTVNSADLMDVIQNQQLVFNAFSNLPGNFEGSEYNIEPADGFPFVDKTGNQFTNEDIVISSNKEDTIKTETGREEFSEKLHNIYEGTIIDSEEEYAEIVNLNGGNQNEKEAVAVKIFNDIYDLDLDEPVIIGGVETPSPYGNKDLFVSTWNFPNSSTSFILPINGLGINEFTVDWGDGSDIQNVIEDTFVYHPYVNSGSYDIVIDGIVDNFTMTSSTFKSNLTDIKQWGNVQLDNNGSQFKDTTNLQHITAHDAPRFWRSDDSGFSSVNNLSSAFGSSGIINGIANWDVSTIEDMRRMFAHSDFNGDLSHWDVSYVQNMGTMFQHTSFDGDISKWDVSRVLGMSSMFSNSQFNGDISDWDMGAVTDTQSMFENSVFTGDISDWDMGAVTDTKSMFAGSQFDGDISKWNVSNIKQMSGMFKESKFNQHLNNWGNKTQNVTNMYDMFSGNIVFDKPLNKWNTSSVTNMRRMFKDATSFNQPLNSWSSGITNLTDVKEMFHGAVYSQDISDWVIPAGADCEDFSDNAGWTTKPNLSLCVSS